MLRILVTILFAETTFAHDPKTVNLQLEASFLVDPGDLFRYKKSGDILNKNILRSAKDILNSFLSPSKVYKPEFNEPSTSEQDSKVLTKFLQDLSTELNNYKEDTLKDLATVLNDEVNHYYRRGPKNAILLNDKIKNYVTIKLKALADSNPMDLKFITRRFASSRRQEDPFDSVDSLNKFFNKQDTQTFDRLIKKLHYSTKLENKDKISETIRETLEFLIIERYNNMNSTEKDRFSSELHKIVGDEVDNSTSIFDTFKTIIDNALKQYIGGLFANDKPPVLNIQGERKAHENEIKKRSRSDEGSNRNEVDNKEEREHSRMEHKTTPYSEFYK